VSNIAGDGRATRRSWLVKTELCATYCNPISILL
jgi:hypothetical protein